jgi:hypothetical protein
MRIDSSSVLTVFHDGRFWVGLCEETDGCGYRACRHVFGTEPDDQRILGFIADEWPKLRFSPTVIGTSSPLAQNPKRRQRDAAKQLAAVRPSTKAQAALAEAHETTKASRKTALQQRKELEKEQRYEQAHEKRKQKHRGH